MIRPIRVDHTNFFLAIKIHSFILFKETKLEENEVFHTLDGGGEGRV